MAKRKDKLTEKLGWKGQIAAVGAREEKKKSANYTRKTYLIEPVMVDRVKETAGRHQVGQNELVRFLLGYALDQLDAGAVELPLEQFHRIKR